MTSNITGYRWVFLHGISTAEFGPYSEEEAAKVAFQRYFGYWPEDAIDRKVYC